MHRLALLSMGEIIRSQYVFVGIQWLGTRTLVVDICAALQALTVAAKLL